MMANEEEWERPIGLTKEYAICVDDSDDDDDMVDDAPSKVASTKCASSSLSISNGSGSSSCRSGNKVSSYFQQSSQRKTSGFGGGGGNQVGSSQRRKNVDMNDERKESASISERDDGGNDQSSKQQKKESNLLSLDGDTIGNSVRTSNRTAPINNISKGQSKIQEENVTAAQDGRGKENEANGMANESDSLVASTDADDSEVSINFTGGGGDEIVSKKDNPFACFAFKARESSSSSALSSSWRAKKRPRENGTTSTTNSSIASSFSSQHQRSNKKKSGMPTVPIEIKQTTQRRKHSNNAFFSKNTSTKNGDNTASKEPKLQSQQHQLAQSSETAEEAQQTKKMERQKLIAKWHAFADPNAPIEVQRFQVLVAARIHARCQEPVVRKAMDRLRAYFDEKDGLASGGSVPSNPDVQSEEQRSEEKTQQLTTEQLEPHSTTTLTQSHTSPSPQGQGLTVHSLSSADPETEIAPLLSSVLFGNAKAKQIVQAARDILGKYRGRVPESICSLKEVTGIGPKLAEILHIVNRRESYRAILAIGD